MRMVKKPGPAAREGKKDAVERNEEMKGEKKLCGRESDRERVREHSSLILPAFDNLLCEAKSNIPFSANTSWDSV